MRNLSIVLLAFCIGACVTNDSELEVSSALHPGCNLTVLRSDSSNGGAVAAAYCAVLDRPADLGGYATQLQELNNGLPRHELLVRLFNSVEFQAVTNTLPNVDFATLLYRRLLLREPDAGGLAIQLQSLNNGLGRETLFRNFVSTQEFHSLWLVI